MLQFTLHHTLPAAYSLLPEAMNSTAASSMLLAIALQESKCQHRLQKNGPAKGFWQFEQAGIKGVLTHERSAAAIERCIKALGYPVIPAAHVGPMHTAVEHNDVLAACFARCLLWTLPRPLAGRDDYDGSYADYIDAWRPGRPHPETWAYNYRTAWNVVLTYGGDRLVNDAQG